MHKSRISDFLASDLKVGLTCLFVGIVVGSVVESWVWAAAALIIYFLGVVMVAAEFQKEIAVRRERRLNREAALLQGQRRIAYAELSKNDLPDIVGMDAILRSVVAGTNRDEANCRCLIYFAVDLVPHSVRGHPRVERLPQLERCLGTWTFRRNIRTVFFARRQWPGLYQFAIRFHPNTLEPEMAGPVFLGVLFVPLWRKTPPSGFASPIVLP